MVDITLTVYRAASGSGFYAVARAGAEFLFITYFHPTVEQAAGAALECLGHALSGAW